MHKYLALTLPSVLGATGALAIAAQTRYEKAARQTCSVSQQAVVSGSYHAGLSQGQSSKASRACRYVWSPRA